MPDEINENAETDFAQIKPAAINLTTSPNPDSPGIPKHKPVRIKLFLLGTIAVSVAAIIVIFLLPRWINTPVIEREPVKPELIPQPVVSSQPAKNATANSPWERAQQSQFRKESQEILEKMLDAEKMLREHGVTVWAEQEYIQAMQYAEAGDNLYNQGAYPQAGEKYNQALEIFNVLVDKIDEVFGEMIERGNKALVDGDSAAAKEAFQVALAIDAIDRNANLGMERAATLDQLLSLLKKGDELLNNDQLEEAKTVFQQASQLDAYSDKARERIQLADQKIQDRDFNRHMSSGFNALESGRFDQAMKSFREALNLKPKSAEARSALNQTRHKITTTQINTLLRKAEKLEEQEQWHEALDAFKAALALNGDLAVAHEGKARTTIRAKIHDRLEQILGQPERVYDKEVYNETVAFRDNIQKVSNPGPILTSQLNKLSGLLDKAATPVPITLHSDNLTEVTLYKVGVLGNFTSKELYLRPGRYTVAGHRDGYVDVRVPIFVDPKKPDQSFTIRTEEKIVIGK